MKAYVNYQLRIEIESSEEMLRLENLIQAALKAHEAKVAYLSEDTQALAKNMLNCTKGTF